MNSTPVGVATAAQEFVVPRSIPSATAMPLYRRYRISRTSANSRNEVRLSATVGASGGRSKMTEAPNWDELFELLGPIHDDVQLFARRIARSNAEGDDVFQEAVLRAARKFGSLRERSKFKSWMHSVVVSVHRTRCRRAFWTRWISSEPAIDAVGDDGTRWVDERASASRAAAALGKLEPAQREAIVLFELHGYAIDEIAEI